MLVVNRLMTAFLVQSYRKVCICEWHQGKLAHLARCTYQCGITALHGDQTMSWKNSTATRRPSCGYIPHNFTLTFLQLSSPSPQSTLMIETTVNQYLQQTPEKHETITNKQFKQHLSSKCFPLRSWNVEVLCCEHVRLCDHELCWPNQTMQYIICVWCVKVYFGE